MVIQLYANLSEPDTVVKQKKAATPKQLAALEKAREARRKKISKTPFPDSENNEDVSSAPPTDTPSTTASTTPSTNETSEPIIPKVEKPVYDIPPDAVPPLWFKNYVSQKIEEKLLKAAKRKRTPKPKPAPPPPPPTPESESEPDPEPDEEHEEPPLKLPPEKKQRNSEILQMRPQRSFFTSSRSRSIFG